VPKKPRKQRLKKTISARVKFLSSSIIRPAYTVDISSTGARIGGLKHLPQIGDLVEIEIQTKREVCRVVWVGEPGTQSEGHMGIVVEGNHALFASSILQQTAKAATATQKKTPRQKVQIEQQPAKKSNTRRNVIGLAILTAAVLGSSIFLASNRPPEPAPTASAISEIGLQDATQIYDLDKWRLTRSSDFDLESSSWLTTMGQQPQGHIPVKFSGDDSSGDSAYIFATIQANHDPRLRRLVIFVKNRIQYDDNFPQIAIAAVIAKNRLANIAWQGKSGGVPPNGDGLLIVRNARDPASAIVVFLSGVRLVTRAPADYRSIQLQ
jgi:hypothetical protein